MTRHPPATRTRCSSRRTSSSAGRARPACWWSAGSCCATGCRRCPAAARSTTSTPPSTTTSPTRRTARRAARPAIVESIRAGLVFQLKEAVGTDVIRAHEERFLRARDRRVARATRTSRSSATSTPSGCRSCRSSCAAPGGRYLHHNFVVALLNDLFGIQSRGGCSCAGPYGHRLLGIDIERSHRFEREILAGCEGIKPGWVRVSFNYFISDAGVPATSSTRCDLVATHGWALLPEYRFDPYTGLWRHRDGLVEPPLRLTDLKYTADGELHWPGRAAGARAGRRGRAGRLPRPRRPTWSHRLADRPGRPAAERPGGTGRHGVSPASRNCAGSTCRPSASADLGNPGRVLGSSKIGELCRPGRRTEGCAIGHRRREAGRDRDHAPRPGPSPGLDSCDRLARGHHERVARPEHSPPGASRIEPDRTMNTSSRSSVCGVSDSWPARDDDLPGTYLLRPTAGRSHTRRT